MKKLITSVLSILFFVFSLPYLAETQTGKKFICQFLFERRGWKSSIESVSFHWNAPQEFTRLVLSNGEFEVLLEHGKIHTSLFEFLKNPFNPITISLESGVVKSDKNSLLHEVLSLLQLALNIDNNIPLQFRKATLSYHKGIYTYQKTDFWVAGRYPFVTWGSFDLNNDTLDIELGPTAKFFESTFKMKHLSRDFVLPFRIKGPFGHANVHTEKAFEELGRIILQQKILGLGKRPE
jgi:hypothetical protein